MVHSALPPAEDMELETLADIAVGGMGVVQLCRVKSGRLEGRAVAVKRLSPELEGDPDFVNMFLDETWITAHIASPHVVKVEAWGRDDQGMFLAVELVRGVSLARLIKESRALSEPFAERTVAHIVSQVCAGLGSAHSVLGETGAPLGVVHRDLTPGNILMGFDGIVKIADFGIAKAEERLTSTRVGTMKGKPAYMAPEQSRGGGVDLRADLFALGVVMFELLAGQRPWSGKTDLELLINTQAHPPMRLQEIRKVSPIFLEIVERCLQRQREDRFSSAEEIQRRLDDWRKERGFIQDDTASLAAFIGRNTGPQQAWFDEALQGEVVPARETFKDLEARIDDRRESQRAPELDDQNVATQFMAASMLAPSAPSPLPEPAPPSSGAKSMAGTELVESADAKPKAARPPGPPPRPHGPPPRPASRTVDPSPTQSTKGVAGPATANPTEPRLPDAPAGPVTPPVGPPVPQTVKMQLPPGIAAPTFGPPAQPLALAPSSAAPNPNGWSNDVAVPSPRPGIPELPVPPALPVGPAPIRPVLPLAGTLPLQGPDAGLAPLNQGRTLPILAPVAGQQDPAGFQPQPYFHPQAPMAPFNHSASGSFAQVEPPPMGPIASAEASFWTTTAATILIAVSMFFLSFAAFYWLVMR